MLHSVILYILPQAALFHLSSLVASLPHPASVVNASLGIILADIGAPNNAVIGGVLPRGSEA